MDDLTTRILFTVVVVCIATPLYVRFWYWFLTKRRVQGFMHKFFGVARSWRTNRVLRRDLRTCATRLRICGNWLRSLHDDEANALVAFSYAEYAEEASKREVK